MKDEIKEIINQLEIVARKHTIEVCEDGSKIETMPASIVDELRLNNYSSRLLLDYITNLQENYDRIYNENCKLREEHNINDISLLDENYNLQKENQRLKEDIEDISVSHFSLFKSYKDLDDYKSRCEKAMKILQGED